MPRGYSMAPPKLPGNAPGADVVHPLEIGLRPVGGNELDAALFHGFDRGIGQRLDLHPPLRGYQRLDDGPAGGALGGAEFMRLDLFEEPQLFEIGHYLLARLETVESRKRSCFGRHLPVLVDHFDARQIVAFAGFEIVGIVRWRDFHGARAELGIGHFVEHDRDLPIHQREEHLFIAQFVDALVGRINGDGSVTEHRFRTRGCDYQFQITADNRINNVPQVALRFLVLHFEVGNGGLAARAPVHHVLAAINKTLFVEPYEGFAHRAREAGIESETRAGPIAAYAGALHLLDDLAAILFFPLPDAGFEFFTAQVVPRQIFLRQLPLHHDLRGDAGMIGTGDPQSYFSGHALPAHLGIDDRVLEHM